MGRKSDEESSTRTEPAVAMPMDTLLWLSIVVVVDSIGCCFLSEVVANGSDLHSVSV